MKKSLDERHTKTHRGFTEMFQQSQCPSRSEESKHM